MSVRTVELPSPARRRIVRRRRRSVIPFAAQLAGAMVLLVATGAVWGWIVAKRDFAPAVQSAYDEGVLAGCRGE